MHTRSERLQILSPFDDHLRFGALATRRFFLDEEIDNDMARRFRMEATTMLAESKEPITIEINSLGGEIVSGFDIIGTIRRLQREGIEVWASVNGDACSMAAVVLAACNKRSMTSFSRLMWHGIQFTTAGDMIDAHNQQTEMDRIIEKLTTILTGSAKKGSKYASPAFIKKLMKEKRPNWITPEEALEAGLVDEVVD